MRSYLLIYKATNELYVEIITLIKWLIVRYLKNTKNIMETFTRFAQPFVNLSVIISVLYNVKVLFGMVIAVICFGFTIIRLNC